MIARVWRGWTKTVDADAYERLLREVVYPGLQAINGYQGGYVLRRDLDDGSEFVTVNLFASLEAVRAFAGDDYEVPVFEPAARPTPRESRASGTPLRRPLGALA
jgi:heme-degrading monooxygenase HmoA